MRSLFSSVALAALVITSASRPIVAQNPSWPPVQTALKHSGDTNPLTEGWGYSNAFQNTVGPVAGPAWQIASTNPGGIAYIAGLSAPAIKTATTNGWEMRANFRVQQSGAAGSQQWTAIVFQTITDRFEISVWLDGDKNTVVKYRLPDVGGVEKYVVLKTFTDRNFHAYEMIYDPATNAVSILIDEAFTGTPQPSSGAAIGIATFFNNAVSWGNLSSANLGTAEYRSFEFISK